MSNAYGYHIGNKIKNFVSLRTATLWAGWLGLLQSLTWIALTITGICAYTCHINVDSTLSYGSLMKTVFLDLYFKGNCYPNIYQEYNTTMLHFVPTVLDPTQILVWDCVYLGVAVFWLIASVLLMTHVVKDDIKKTLGVLYTWIVLVLFVNLMDLALGIIFGIDYGRYDIAAYGFNFNSINAGAIDPNAAQLIAAMVTAMSMMIISFKGFILWIINVGLMIYLLIHAISISYDKDGNDTLFVPRKESDDVLTTRTPIQAYEEQVTATTVYANEGFVPETQPTEVIELNQDPIVRAARMSTDVSLQDRRFRNVESFQQYPPPRYGNKPDGGKKEMQVMATPATGVAVFPTPDYSPPMSRSNQGQSQNGLLRNQRY